MSTAGTLGQAYGVQFERALAWMLLHDMRYADVAYNALDSDCFESKVYGAIFDAGKTLYTTTRVPVGDVGIRAALTNARNTARVGSKNHIVYERALAKLDALSRDTRYDAGVRSVVEQQTAKFVTKARVRNALLQCGTLWETDQFDDILRNVEQAVRGGDLLKKQDLGIDFNNVKQKLSLYKKQRVNVRACPVGIPLMDSKIRGGLDPAALGIIMAPAKRGKSLFLVNAAANSLLRGLNVAVVSLELRKHDYAQRFDARLTGIPINELATNYAAHASLVRKRTRRLTGRLFIQSWGSNTASTNDVHVWLKALDSRYGFKPDLLVVDYIDLLIVKTRRNDRPDTGEICKALRQMGEDFNCAVWSASQTNRGSFHGRTIDLEDVAEDLQKIQVADVIMGWAQTQKEKDNKRGRLVLLGNRQGGHEGTIVDCGMTTETMTLTQAKTQPTLSKYTP